MAQSNVKFMAEVDHFFGFEGNSIVSDDFLRETKSGKDIVLKESDNSGVIGLVTWDGFNPLGEIVSGWKNPFVLA